MMATPSPFVNAPPSQPTSQFSGTSSLSMPSMSLTESSSDKSNAVKKTLDVIAASKKKTAGPSFPSLLLPGPSPQAAPVPN
jgi:hypothetical protein